MNDIRRPIVEIQQSQGGKFPNNCSNNLANLILRKALGVASKEQGVFWVISGKDAA